MIYLDTNVIVSMHVVDSTSAAAEVWASQQTAQMAISTWSIAEFVGNISLRVRKGAIPARGARRVVDAFDTKFSPSLVVLGANDAATCVWHIGCAIHPIRCNRAMHFM